MTGREADEQFLYLTTIGRRTGLPRSTEVWFTWYDGRYYVISELRDRAQWVRNILADPAVEFSVANRASPGRARLVEPAADPDLHARVRALSDGKYGWSDGLIVEIATDISAE